MPEVRYVGLGALLAKGQAAVTASVEETAGRLVQEAQGDAPVLTGALSGGITADGVQAGVGGATVQVHTSGPADEYATYVESGTVDTPTVPFMEQAVAAVGPELQAKTAEHARQVF